MNRVPAGVDDAAYVKAAFLRAIVKDEASSPLIDKKKAVFYLGTMLGGFNVETLVELLHDEQLAEEAVKALSKTLLMFDAANDVFELAKKNPFAKQVVDAWSEATWFTDKPKVAEKIKLTVFKVDGETNTDDLSPAGDAWSRPDIPLHSLAMLKMRMPDALQKIEELKEGNPLVYVGDVVGTGSSRKSATNSVLWTMGKDIPYIPNKRDGGYCFGNKIAPIFFNTMERCWSTTCRV